MSVASGIQAVPGAERTAPSEAPYAPDARRNGVLRIAMVAACPMPERRGTPVRIQRIAEGLQRLGHEVHLVTYPYGNGDFAAPVIVHRVGRAGTHYRTAPGPSLSKLFVLDPLMVGLLRRVLREGGIDIIHAHHYEGLLVSLVARGKRRVPLVYDAHTLLGSELPAYAPHLPQGMKRMLGTRLDRCLPGYADHVISVTDGIRDQLIATTPLGRERVTCVSNGVETDVFRAPDPTDGAHPPTVVFAGNLAPYQGIELLLDAFRRVLDAHPGARLRIVSESSFAPYEAQARTLGVRDAIEVVAAPFEALPSLLASADVAVNPRPDCDGIPLKLLNYMAAARPAVSFEGSAPGVEHGSTGWLAPRGNVDAFAAGILTLLRDAPTARSIGSRARDHVQRNHSWEVVATQTEGVYHDVLRRMSAPARRPMAGAHTAHALPADGISTVRPAGDER
ncbi:MAG TPA: glycosyltransferase family 4 protein [Gemmatimonadaceae bacterium]|nr:glycosyltransferase family 4 protein [Gemmatimonadaceae bacterium]